MKYAANYYKNKYHIVEIKFEGQKRTFRLFSGRAAKALELMVNSHPNGISTSDMRELHGIDDNKLFGELLDQSGFREFMFNRPVRNKLKVWDIDLHDLFLKTTETIEPLYFGIASQGNIGKHVDALIKKQGLKCNILKIDLLKNSKGAFLGNFRKIAIDHRVPQLKRGSDEIDNLQILSYYVNERKNQICAKCNELNCDNCALAYPEKSTIVKPTKEEIGNIMKRN